MARRLSKQDIISNVYYNLESGFGSIQDTLKQAKEKDPTINRVDVANWLKQQPNKQIRRYRGSNSYTATLLPQALAKYNSSHSSTKMTPKEAHDDKNHMDVRVNLTRREKNTRKYPEINVNDKVKVFQKGRGNYTDRKEYVSKWTTQTYKVKEIKYDTTGSKNFILDGLNKPYLRHEILGMLLKISLIKPSGILYRSSCLCLT